MPLGEAWGAEVDLAAPAHGRWASQLLGVVVVALPAVTALRRYDAGVVAWWLVLVAETHGSRGFGNGSGGSKQTCF